MTTDVLVVTSLYRPNYLWFNSVVNQKYTIGRLDLFQMYLGYPKEEARGIDTITHKMNEARGVFLSVNGSGSYDYMISLEDDNIILRDTDIQSLVESAIAYDAGVIYSPYVFRNANNLSSCAVALNPDKGYYYTADKFVLNYSNWLQGKDIVECDGMGLGFTCISRDTLAKIEFRQQTAREIENWGYVAHCDTTFSVDCINAGIKQYCNFGIPNGHIHYDEKTAYIMIPDYRHTGFIRKEYIE